MPLNQAPISTSGCYTKSVTTGFGKTPAGKMPVSPALHLPKHMAKHMTLLYTDESLMVYDELHMSLFTEISYLLFGFPDDY